MLTKNMNTFNQPNTSERLTHEARVEDSTKVFGLWAYLMTDLVLFASLFVVFAVLRGNTFGGPSGAQIYDMPYVFVETIILLLSSFTAGLSLSLLGLALGSLVLVLRRRLPATRAAHDFLDWPERWPSYCVGAAVLLIAASAITVDRSGRVSLSARWKHSVHQFTWGSGIEAMKELPRK